MISFLKKNDGLLVIIAPVLLVLSSIFNGMANPSLFILNTGFSAIGELFGLDTLIANRLVQGIITVVVALVAMIFVNRVIANNSLLGQLSNMPLIVCAILFGIIPAEFQNVLFWVTMLLYVQFITTLLSCLLEHKVFNSVFNAGFILGMLVLIYPMYILLFIPLIGVLIINSTINLRLTIIATLGVSTPIYICVALLYILAPSKLAEFVSQIYLNFSLEFVAGGIEKYILAIVVLLSVVVEGLNSRFMTMREKRIWRFEMILLFSSFLVLFTEYSVGIMALALVPSIIILSRALINSKNNRISQLLFITLILSVAINIALSL